jgi:hypothetical protein
MACPVSLDMLRGQHEDFGNRDVASWQMVPDACD